MIETRWQRYVVAGLLAIAAYQLFAEGSPLARIVLYPGVTLTSGLALLIGSRSHPPGRRLPWRIMAAGQYVAGLADIIWFGWLPVVGTEPPFPSLPDWLYLPAYLLLVSGLGLLVRARTRART